MKRVIKPKTNKLLNIIKSISFLALLIYAFFFFDVQPALAHRPHDVIEALEISPNYEQDKTVFIVVRKKFLKSTDGGSSWHRVVQGIDNKYNLSTLSISRENNKIIFLSSLGDGIYKSENAGSSWFKVNNGLKSLNIGLVSVYPSSPDIVLAAGQETGLYKTKTGGETWYEIIDTNNPINAIGFSTDNKGSIIIGDKQGILYYSSDEGDTWKQGFTLKKSGAITAIAVSPNFSSDKTFWVGTEKGGVFKTVDNGNSFAEVNHGILDKNIRDIVVSPNYEKDLTLFASTWDEGAFQSKDGGKTWHKHTKGLTKDEQADESKFKSPHFSYLRISKAFSKDKTLFLAGFNGLFKSKDGGRTWRELETLSTRVITSLSISPNYKNDSTIAIGLYEKEGYISHDKGVTWVDITNGLEIPRVRQKKMIVATPRFFDITFSPNYSSDNTIFSALIYRFVKSTNRGNSWNRISLKQAPGSDQREILIAPSPNFADDKTIYLATIQGLIYKSTDRGSNFSIAGKVGHQIHSLATAPDFSVNKTLYASGPEGVYKTVDGGQTWQPVTNKSDLIGITWLQLAISPNYKMDKTVLIATNTGVFKTTNGGESWEKLTDSTYGKDAYIEAIAVSPNYQVDQTLIISVRGRGLFKTIDGGKSFTEVGKDLINKNYSLSEMVMSTSVPIKFSPSYSIDKTIYGFGSARSELFKSTDGGNTWKIIPIPKNQNKIDEFVTFAKLVNLAFTIYPFLRFIAASIVALLIYLLLKYLNLEKRFSCGQLQIRVVSSFVAFVLVIIVLSI